MAIPIAAALKVVLAERLHARDTAGADSEASEDSEATEAPRTADGTTPAPATGTAARGD